MWRRISRSKIALRFAAAEVEGAGDDPRGRELGMDGDGLVAGVGFGGIFRHEAGRRLGL